MSSAAALGVSARRSAAKSQSVKSISWPTAETIGTGQAATARTSGSSLKAHRSSRLPPPRPITRRSHSPRSSASRSICTISAAAPSPCTRAGSTTTRPRQLRRARMRRKSCTAAPVGEVMNPHCPRQGGQRLLPLRREEPLRREPRLERLELALQPPHAVVDHQAHDQLILPARLVHAHLAVHDHLQAVAQLHRLPQGVAAEQHRAELGAGRP
jgi:hypothetical protein